MKSLLLIVATIMALLLIPGFSCGQSYQGAAASSQGSSAQVASPPISQPLVREGMLATKLVTALNLGSTTDEAQAESLLSSVGIAPRNGWIADYPVTPDIANELRDAVTNAAASGSIKMSEDTALVAYDDVMSQYDLAFKGDDSGKTGTAESYPDQTVSNNYYSEEGPPIVTYYAPPADYASLYSWVPYPFWWWNFWFPGFFVLADFDRPFFFGGHVFFVSNHFFDRDRDDFVRVNAFERFHDFNRFHDRALVSRTSSRVIGPSSVRAGTEAAFRHEGIGTVEHGRVVVNRGSIPRERGVTPRGSEGMMNTPSRERGAVPSRDFGRSVVENNRTFDRGNIISREVERPSHSFTMPSRTFSSPRVQSHESPSFGSPRSFGGSRNSGSFGSFHGGGFHGGGMRR